MFESTIIECFNQTRSILIDHRKDCIKKRLSINDGQSNGPSNLNKILLSDNHFDCPEMNRSINNSVSSDLKLVFKSGKLKRTNNDDRQIDNHQLTNQSVCSSVFNTQSMKASYSSYLLNSSFQSSYQLNHPNKATKPNPMEINKKQNQSSSFAFSLILFCFIQLLIANGVRAVPTSTAFDYQNKNQADKDLNSIVYQDATSTSISDLHIECDSNMIVLVLNTQNEQFNGLIYPKGLSKNSTCMVEYNNQNSNNITYILPLRSCNTMSTDVEDGVEYYNTIVVQPHRRLVTNQGKGYHIRCRYQTKEKSITNFFNVTTIGNVPISASAPIPLCSMKISLAEDTDTEIFVAENVKIGDKLKLEIKIEEQPVYGMKVTNCLVRDGLNWAEQILLNDEGCPVDEEILGQFRYNKNLTKATVSFQAHKFPYTSSVYYQCNVRLCLKQAGGCSDTPPNCDQNRHNFRKRRDLNKPSFAAALRTGEIKELSVEVYSGLYVNEADSEEADLLPPKKIVSEQEFCISMRKFVVGVTIASMLLMTAVILLVACILQRRRRRKNISTTCSIYSGPYSNRGFT